MLHTTRRRFLGSAAATLPAWFLDECRAQPEAKAPTSKTDKPGIALVGCGGRGQGDLGSAARFGRVVALCDVDDNHIAIAKKKWPAAATEHDFRKVMERKDVDVVVCGTVDHWHTLVSLAAMRAGKDVYCEKPLTLTIDEGQHLARVQRETKRILQTGTQQRSDFYFRTACELVRNNKIGKLKSAH